MNAIRKMQEAYDARVPDESDYERNLLLAVQVGKLLRGEDADGVPFFSQRFQIPAVQGFCDRLYEHLSEIDSWPEGFVIQLLLAVGRGDHELASAIYEKHLRSGINEFAEQQVQEAAA